MRQSANKYSGVLLMGKRPNGDGTISRYKDGWRGRYTDPKSHQQRAVYGRTQGECKEKLDAKIASIKGGVYVPPNKLLTGAWIKSWFAGYYCINTKQSTQSTTWRGLRAYILPEIENVPLQKITPDHIQAIVRSMQSKGLAPSTIQRHVGTLVQCLEQAVSNEKIAKNPAAKITMPDGEEKEIEAFTPDEQAVLLQNLPDTTNGRAIRFLLGTGMRVSELCGLKWSDIKASEILIQRQHMTIKDWKSDGYVDIEQTPKTQPLRALLEYQKKAQAEERLKAGEGYSYNGYVFATATGKAQDRNNIGRTLRSVCRRSGIPPHGVHSLRHTFATRWVQCNPDIVSLSKILGHANPAFTYKVYCHSDQDAMHKGMEQMQGIITVQAL